MRSPLLLFLVFICIVIGYLSGVDTASVSESKKGLEDSTDKSKKDLEVSTDKSKKDLEVSTDQSKKDLEVSTDQSKKDLEASVDSSQKSLRISVDHQGETSGASGGEPEEQSAPGQSTCVNNANLCCTERMLCGRTSTWNRFIELVKDYSEEENVRKSVLEYADEYFPNNKPQFIRCGDNIGRARLGNPPSMMSGIPLHVPRESKVVRSLSSIHNIWDKNLVEKTLESHFPRVKNFRKKLVVLPPEPYQRVMSFAIEQCMIPSIWYLELVHCMYSGMAPLFSGMIFSYSLQDIVGSAVMSIGYKDESFHIENCYNAVSLVVDDIISSRFMDVCAEVLECLKSKEFETLYHKQRKEFEERMEKAYSTIAPKSGFMTPMQFYRYSVLLSMSLIRGKNGNTKAFPERNFLIIRIALASLAYYAISTSQGWIFESEKKVSMHFTKLILSTIFELTIFSIRKCNDSLLKLSKHKSKDASFIFEMFCKEMMSAGFVFDMVYKLNVDEDLYSVAIMPWRILDRSYSSLVPDMIEDLPLEMYDNSWVYAQIDVARPDVENVGGVQREYRSKMLKKTTKKLRAGGIKAQASDLGAIGTIKTGRMTRMTFRKFTKRLTRTKK